MSACVLLLRYQPTKTNLIELLPQSIRSACMTPNKEIPPSFVQQQQQQQYYPTPPSFVCPSTTTKQTTTITTNPMMMMNQMSRQQCYSKKIYESSESGGDEYDPNWSRQDSKDDEFLVPGTAGLHYGSVPYQHGGSSSRRYVFFVVVLFHSLIRFFSENFSYSNSFLSTLKTKKPKQTFKS